MRRRIKHSKIETELFPFLSVLACTIGSLILLIIVVSTESLSDKREVTIIAENEEGGLNRKKQPRYIECQEDGVIIYPNETFVHTDKLDQPDSALIKLIEEVKEKQDQEYVIVAVRPSGIDVFQQVRELIETEGIDIGYEPIEDGWTLKIEQ